MLAEMAIVMPREKFWVLAQDDINQAFDNVIITDVMADHANHITEPSLLALIRMVLQGNDAKRNRGIDQGNPYSPTALNMRLHHAVDLAAHQGHHPLRYYRYADNLVWLCRSVAEGNQAIAQTNELLQQVGFNLKGEDGTWNLQQDEKAELLGFILSEKNGQLHFDLGREAWSKTWNAYIEQTIRHWKRIGLSENGSMPMDQPSRTGESKI